MTARIELRPFTKREANAAVLRWHRHHDPVLQYRWAIGALVGGEVVGAVIVENPKAEGLNNGVTLEVTRLVTDGTPHAASRLLGGAWGAARAMGCRRMVSYIRADETGRCYLAAGWHRAALVKGREWSGVNKPGRWLPGLYEPSTEIVDRWRWEVGPDCACDACRTVREKRARGEAA